jgi:hypothetical protein
MSTDTPINAALQDIVRQFDGVAASARELVRGLDEAQFNWQLAPERWSIGQNVAHLNIAARDTFPFLDAMLQSARGKGAGSPPYSRTFVGRLTAWVIEPPYRIRVKTRSSHVPRSELSMSAEMTEFENTQAEYNKRVRAAEGLNICGVKENLNLLAGNTKAPPANLNLYDWFIFIAAHERRHLWQALQVRNNPAFPH